MRGFEPTADTAARVRLSVAPSADTDVAVLSNEEEAMPLHVDGSWSGWDGDTIVRLTDGSVWQQAEYHYEYHYAYRPTVRIEHEDDGRVGDPRVGEVPLRQFARDWLRGKGSTRAEVARALGVSPRAADPAHARRRRARSPHAPI